jgi:hypothetical protein
MLSTALATLSHLTTDTCESRQLQRFHAWRHSAPVLSESRRAGASSCRGTGADMDSACVDMPMHSPSEERDQDGDVPVHVHSRKLEAAQQLVSLWQITAAWRGHMHARKRLTHAFERGPWLWLRELLCVWRCTVRQQKKSAVGQEALVAKRVCHISVYTHVCVRIMFVAMDVCEPLVRRRLLPGSYVM